jgi:hypothetical protein
VSVAVDSIMWLLLAQHGKAHVFLNAHLLQTPLLSTDQLASPTLDLSSGHGYPTERCRMCMTCSLLLLALI